jgi:hypothetical protein
MPTPCPTDEQLADECREMLAHQVRYNLSRSLSEGPFSWGEWLDAAETALDCGDFSEIRWMRGLPDPETESAADFADYLYDFARDAVLVAQYEARAVETRIPPVAA